METIYIVTRNALIEPLPTHMVKEKSHETALIRYFLFMNGIKLLLQKKKKKIPDHKEVSQAVTCSHRITFFTRPDKKIWN